MSSKQRKLALKKNDFAVLETTETRSDSSQEDDSLSLQPSANPYAILDDSEIASNDSQPPPDDELQNTKPDGTKKEAKKTKKKKKPKKKPQKPLERPEAFEDEAGDEQIQVINEIIETEIQEQLQSASSVFGLSLKSLKGDEDLHKLFGAKVVASVDAELELKKRKQASRAQASSSGRRERRFMRTFILSEPRPEWIPRESNLIMTHKGSTEEGEIFEYEATGNYQSIHEVFVECQDAGQMRVLGHFLTRHPYHVEALLAMHDVLEAIENHGNAEDCLNLALFSLESCWDRKFVPHTGRCRLDYEVDLNKLLFQALFRHVQHLNSRGCLKTAFECGKFLLGLDKSDPLGVMCMIDYLAIRAGEFGYLEKLIYELPDGSAMAIRPGFAFSSALCKHKQGKEEESQESLVQAVLMHPLAVSRLMNKIKSTGVRLNSQWETILKFGFFSNSTDGGNASLNHLVNIFVERHHLLYKSKEVLDWMLDGVTIAFDCVKYDKEYKGTSHKDWTCIRTANFPPDSRNHLRNLHIYDFSDEIARIPLEMIHEEGIEEAEREMIERLELRDTRGAVRLTEEDLRDANAIAMFLRSLLPWFRTDTRDPTGN